jgi:hypothetical protein
MTQAQLVGYKAQPSEGLDALGAPSPDVRRELPDDLSLCFVCMQWACSNPGCRSGQRCDLQAQLDRQLAAPA